MAEHNVNVNGYDSNPNNNVIDNGKYERARKVEVLADKLVERFGLDSDSKPFMCKVAYKLSEARIWSNFEQATSKKGKKIDNPVGLFIFLCKKDGV